MDTQFALHRAVIKNEVREVIRLLDQKTDDERPVVDVDERDTRGIPPIHYAIHMGNRQMVKVLLERGADPARKSGGGWSTMQEAIASNNRAMVRDILVAIQMKIVYEYEKRLPTLVKAVEKIPDFYMELKWEFHSWVPLVSRLCPSDTYKIWKRGSSFRVDTTLVGFEGAKWIRGDLSYLFRGDQGGEVLILDHKKKIVERAFSSKSLKVENAGSVPDAEIRRLMSPVLTKTSPLMDNVQFNAAKTWLGYEKTEKVGDDEWKAKVFNFDGFDLRMISRKRIRRKGEALPVVPADQLQQDLLEKCDVQPAQPHLGLLHPYEEISEKNKSYKGTIWLSEDFPRTVEELVPIFETLAPTQKHFKKLNEFISMKMPTDGFPVKLDIPVFPTVTASVTFLTHQEEEPDADKFDIPAEYKWVDPATRAAAREKERESQKEKEKEGEKAEANREQDEDNLIEKGGAEDAEDESLANIRVADDEEMDFGDDEL